MELEHSEEFLEILNEPAPFFVSRESKKSNNNPHGDGDDDDESERRACERLLDEFAEAEVEEIANVSHAHWFVGRNAKAGGGDDNGLPLSGDDVPRRRSALKEIRRHYVGEGRDPSKAVAAVREALGYRRRYRFDVVRSCFYDDDRNGGNAEDDADDRAKKAKRLILDDLRRQPMVVRGIDDDRRVVVYKPPRVLLPEDDGSTSEEIDEAFLLTQIYTAERAMATTEFHSRVTTEEEKVTVVFDFRNYVRKNMPSTSTVIAMIRMVQRCYPERLGVLVVVDAPFWMRAVYNMVWPFLSAATRDKLRFASGRDAVGEELRKIAGGNEELRVMLEDGDISSVDLTDYTRQPFYSPYEPLTK